MLDLQRIIENHYNEEQRKFLQTKTKDNYEWNPTGQPPLDFTGISFLPLALINEDKKLTVKGYLRPAITETQANDTDYMMTLCGASDYKTPNILVLYCKRGWTFLDAWARNHGFTYLNRETMYLQTGVNHRIRIHKKEQYTLVITNELTVELEKRLFSAIPLLYKEEFTWTPDVINYFRYVDTNEALALDLFKKILDETKLLENLKYEQLKQTLTDLSNYTVRQHQQQLKTIEQDIKYHEEVLQNYYLKLQKEQAFVAFFKPQTNFEETADYMLHNPYIVDYYSVDQKYLVIAIEAPLEYIDISAFKQMLKNPQSYLYPKWSENQGSYSELTKNHPIEFVEMLKDLFLSNKYRVYTRSEIVLDLDKKEAKPLRKVDNLFRGRPTSWQLKVRADDPNKCITPHMHIEYYDCWSGNKTNISKALAKTDLIGALDICINTTKDINVNDSAVFGRFIKEYLTKPKEMQTGNVSGNQAIHTGLPGNEYKTIWDNTKKCFRTFLDIFENDYLKEKVKQVDLEINLENLI